MKKVPLEDQIDSLVTACENLEEAINILRRIDAINPQILHKLKYLEELQAALNTLKWLDKNKHAVLSVANGLSKLTVAR
jgi:hypothetical protein